MVHNACTGVVDDLANSTDDFVSRGSTGRTTPNNLNEQLFMKDVRANPLSGATDVPVNMTDPRWLGTEGWAKMQRTTTFFDGSRSTIHYNYNKTFGWFDDFKFK